MGTRSRIGMLLPDGRVRSIYCHWDGYPEYNGKILQECWQESVIPLLALGNLSSLGRVLGKDEGYGAFDRRKNFAEDDERQLWCCAYGRDRGEKNVKARMHPMSSWPDSDQEWEYLWNGKQWKVRRPGEEWERLQAVLARLEKAG